MCRRLSARTHAFFFLSNYPERMGLRRVYAFADVIPCVIDAHGQGIGSRYNCRGRFVYDGSLFFIGFRHSYWLQFGKSYCLSCFPHQRPAAGDTYFGLCGPWHGLLFYNRYAGVHIFPGAAASSAKPFRIRGSGSFSSGPYDAL